jgi:hypothetical protein
MSGYMRAPRRSKGMRSAQRPRLLPAIDGEAESSRPWRSLKGWGRWRDTQSMLFFRAPGSDALYSGEATTKP